MTQTQTYQITGQDICTLVGTNNPAQARQIAENLLATLGLDEGQVTGVLTELKSDYEPHNFLYFRPDGKPIQNAPDFIDALIGGCGVIKRVGLRDLRGVSGSRSEAFPFAVDWAHPVFEKYT